MLSVTAPAPHDWVAVGGRRGEAAAEKLLVDASCLRRLYQTPGQGLPTRNSGFAPLRGVYFWTRPVLTSAV